MAAVLKLAQHPLLYLYRDSYIDSRRKYDTVLQARKKRPEVPGHLLPIRITEVEERLNVAEMTQEWISAESTEEELPLNIIC